MLSVVQPPFEELKHATLGMSFIVTCTISQERDSHFGTTNLPHVVGYLPTQREVYIPVGRNDSQPVEPPIMDTEEHNVSHNALFMYSG